MEDDKHYATVVLDESLSPAIPGSDSVRRNSKDSGPEVGIWRTDLNLVQIRVRNRTDIFL